MFPFLNKAEEGGYAVGAFNINNMEFLQATVNAALAEKSPIIIQTTESSIKYAGLDYLVAMAKTAKKQLNFCLHLDHGKDLAIIKKCIRAGYDSIMIDASSKGFKENIKITKQVVKLAGKTAVEAELGVLGQNKKATDPDKAKEFVEKTGIDALAPAIGNKHGLYKGKPDLKFGVLKEIKEKVDIPLVLHGSSDLPKKDLKKSIKLGIRKINCDTDLRITFANALRASGKKETNPRKILGPARKAVEEKVKEKIKIFKSSGKL